MNRANKYLANVTFLTFIRVVFVGVIVCICHHATPSDGKVFERCELAQLLRYGHGLDVSDVANWVCIAQHSSSLNSSAFGGDARSGSHGLFQISDQYWCSPPGKGVACGVTCDRLRDDDIGDDLECIRVIYQEHQRLSGDGYNAWIAYQPYCRDNPYEYVEDCFGNEEKEYLHSKSITANYIEDEEEEENDYDPYSKKSGKVYGRCELAKELFLKHKMPMEEIPTWVCIAQHESNYDTSAVGRLNADGSADHGLFQISDLYWCSHKGSRRKACGLPCNKLLDSDITDDVKCVKQIFKEHTRISGDGFTAWTVYNAYCHGKTANYIRGCFDGIDVEESKVSEEYLIPSKPSKPSKGGKQKSSNRKPHGKVYEPCELAEELRSKHRLPEDQIATWVCIAKHESDYNTSAIGYGDHGLFQISDIYWCSPPGKGWACGLSCADLEDSDISDDVECIRKIHAEHTHLSGDGFNAWTVYPRHCSEGRSDKYISHCTGNHPRPAVTAPPHTYSKLTNPNSIEDDYEPKRGKIYGRCELAKELLTKHGMSMDEIPTWVCIAHHESSYDTSAVGRLNTDGSADHGLFQISDLYWCSHKEGHRKACGLPCSKLLDNDITDDIKCIKQIHNEHTRISGDGFTAWTVYNAYCKDRTEEYIRGCFDGSASAEDFNPYQRTTAYGYLPKNKPKGKVYEECELANELRDKYHMPKEQISSWVCIAKHQSGLNTSSSVSDVHGMFHISDEYWCSPPGKGKVCELHCSDLEDSDITDDVECIRKIYLEHQRLFGNGFSAWVVYPQHCSNGRADDYVGHCPGFESPTTNAISYGKPKFIDITRSNKPVYDHVFNANPFLKHFELVNSDAASKIFSDPIEESFSASDEVDTVLPGIHEYSLNPFLKHIKPEQEKPTEAHIKTTTSPPAFLGVPIAPTPTKSTRLQTYQPKNEEQAKNEAFKAFATPSLPFTTQTPRTNRLQTYKLNTFNTFKTFATPSLPTTHAPTTTNRLQPYQMNTFNSFKVSATPTTQPLSTRIPSIRHLPTVQPKPHTTPIYTTRTPLTLVAKDSGRYDSGRYDSGRYDAGRYDPGRYNPTSKITTNTNSRIDIKSAVLSSGQYPIATPSLQSKAPTSIKIISTGLSSSKPFATLVQRTEQPSNTRFPSISSNTGRYEPFKAIATTTVTTKPASPKFDPFKAFTTTTFKPTTTVTSSKKFEAYKAVNSGKYVPYKPPSISKDSGKYIPDKSLATSPPPTKSNLNSGIRRPTSPTKKFDPFKPLGTSSATYNPFKAFNNVQKQSSSFNFLSGKETSSNELDFALSPNSKRETETSRHQASAVRSSAGDLRASLTIKRETKVSGEIAPSSAESKESEQKPTTNTSSTSFAQQQKPVISTTKAASSITASIKPQVTGIAKPPTKSATGGSESVTPTRSGVTTSSARSPLTSKPTRSVSTIEAMKSTATDKSKTATSTRSGVTNSSARSPSTSTRARSVSTIGAARPTATLKPATSTKSVPRPTPTRSVRISTTTKPTSAVTIKPSHPVSSQLITSPTRSPERSSVTTTRTTKSATSTEKSKLTSNVSQQYTAKKTRSVPSSSVTRSLTGSISTSATIKPSSIVTSKATSNVSAKKTRSVSSSSATGSINTFATAKPAPIVTSKPTLSAYREYKPTPTRSVATSTPTRLPTTRSSTTSLPTRSLTTSSLPKTTIKPTATVTSPQPSLVPTRTESKKSLNPSKVTTTPTRSPTRSTSKRPSTATVISPTKSRHSPGSLYSSKLNIFELYYKLYGVYPPIKTSSGIEQVTKTSQTNVVPSRTS